MNTKSCIKIIGLTLLAFVLSGCAAVKDANKPFKHNTPLIKEDIRNDAYDKMNALNVLMNECP